MSDQRDILATHHDANVTLHEHPNAPSARLATSALMACSLLTLSIVSGCVIPPPIITVVEEEYPPFISSEFVSPSDQIIQVTTADAVTLQLNAVFDQNIEDNLYVVWYSRNSGVIGNDIVSLVTEDEDPDAFNIYYTYGPSETVVIPCAPENANALSDVVWVYVSDQPWATINDFQGVQEQLGAFKTSYSWVLEFNVLCT